MYVCFEEVGGKGGEKLVSNFNCNVSFLQLGFGTLVFVMPGYLRYFIIFNKRRMSKRIERDRTIILSMSLVLPVKR